MKLFYASCITFFLLLPISQSYAQGLDLSGLGSTPVSAAYSTRLLSSAYNGFCLRIRRSSDNAVADLAFDPSFQSITNNSIVTITDVGSSSSLTIGSTQTFASFYAGTSCFVSTWYDQSGHSFDAVQTNTADQPRIVDAGVVDALKGRTALSFQTSLQHMFYNGAGLTVQTINAVRSAPDLTWQTLLAMPANNDFSVRGALGGLYNPTPNSNDWYYQTGSPNQFWVNGVQSPTYTGTVAHTITANASSAVTNTMSIGTTINGRGMQNGAKVLEIILFPSSLPSAERQALETNQNANFISLPLHIVRFKASRNNSLSHLEWQTADESNTKQFVIERKNAHSDFLGIGTIPAKGLGDCSYSYDDATNVEGTVYYRLKMIDIDYAYTYSQILTISVDLSRVSSKAYPNPTRDIAYIYIGNKDLLNTQARLLNANGQFIYRFTINNAKQPVQLIGQPAGIYIVKFENGELLRIIKE